MENKEKNNLEILRHSTAHLLADAVINLYPEVKIAIGPSIENGFYYDFDFGDTVVSDRELGKIEQKMKELLKVNSEIVRKVVSKDEALAIFKDQPYKVELINGLPTDEEISVYSMGKFTDLCRGPHIESTKAIGKNFKLMKLAGAYWRGDAKNKMLTRIYGTVWETKEDLNHHLEMLAEAEKRDHRKLNKDLDIYTASEEVGRGLPLWTENGTIIVQELEFLATQKERKYGLKRVKTPNITKENLYQTSGHLKHYKDDMYSAMDIDGEDYYLKPMNCPHHHYIYKRKNYSYKELPVRMTEYGTVYRYEASGSLSGLMRVRAFTQNDIHIYCREDQAMEEFKQIMLMHEEYYNIFDIDKDNFYIEFALPDMDNLEKFVDDAEGWKKAKDIMKQAIDECGFEYKEATGEAAFYGPKADFKVKSAIGTEYAISTNQLDFFASKAFDMTYMDAEQKEQNIYVVHAAPLGSHERFVGFLTEHYAGHYPLWLSPKQLKVIPIADRHNDYATEVFDKLWNADIRTATAGLRVEKDLTSTGMQKKIKRAQVDKVPYMLVLGDKEQENKTVSLRLNNGKQIFGIDLDKFISVVKSQIEGRKDLSDEELEKVFS